MGSITFVLNLLRNAPCNGKEELRKKEGEYIRWLKPTMKTNIAGRSKTDYYNENRTNQLQMREYSNKLVEYECGCIIPRGCLTRHKKTKKHNG